MTVERLKELQTIREDAKVALSKTQNVRFTDEALARREAAKSALRAAEKEFDAARELYEAETDLPSPCR